MLYVIYVGCDMQQYNDINENKYASNYPFAPFERDSFNLLKVFNICME